MPTCVVVVVGATVKLVAPATVVLVVPCPAVVLVVPCPTVVLVVAGAVELVEFGVVTCVVVVGSCVVVDRSVSGTLNSTFINAFLPLTTTSADANIVTSLFFRVNPISS